MSFTTVKKELNKLDKAKLIALVGDLYKKHKNVQEYLDHFANPDEKGLFEKYKERVIQAFFPVRGWDYDLRKGKQAIADFRKLEPSPRQLADLMLVYVETGVEFTNQFGDINETFYSSLESVYHQTLKLLKNETLLPKFEKRLRKVLTDTSDIGWGFHDTLCDYFVEYFDDD